MNKLDKHLDSIISNSGINFYNDYVEATIKKKYSNLNIVEDINDIWDKISCTERMAIYGAGSHTLKLFDIVDKDSKNIICIVDKLKPNGTLCGYPLIKDYEMKDYNIDTIFISTLGFKDEVKQEISNIIPGCKIIDIYDELKLKKYSFKEPFYYQKKYEIYYKIHAISNMCKETEGEEYYSNLIFKYLIIRDFDSAFQYIDYYIDNKLSQYKKYIKFKTALKEFHSTIINQLEKKKVNNGLVILIDGLRYKDVQTTDMPYLTSSIKEGIWCSNAYTHVPYTHMCLESMFTEQKLLDNNLFNNSSVSKNERLFNEINRLGGSFTYSGTLDHIFPKDMIDKTKYGCCSEILWNYICNIYDSIHINVNLLHFAETHTPFICGNHKEDIIMYGVFSRDKPDNVYHEFNQHREAVKYVDRQLNFYMNFFMNNTSIIICSDHGYILDVDKQTDNKQFWNEDLIHIPYAIIKKNINSKIDNRLVSHLDTVSIMLNLINGKEPFDNIDDKQIIEVNRDFTYSKNDLNSMKELGLLDLGRAFKCLVSKNDKYVLFYNGLEEYYLLSNEDNNLIHDEKYKLRIEYFRKNINKKFPDWSENRFEYVKEYYF